MKSKQKIAIIFSRYALPPEQNPVSQDSYSTIIAAQGAASRLLESGYAAANVIEQLLAYAAAEEVETLDVYGAIPPILRAELHLADLATSPEHYRGFVSQVRRPAAGHSVDLYLWEAHNLRLPQEGERPQFEFYRWVLTGHYLLGCQASEPPPNAGLQT